MKTYPQVLLALASFILIVMLVVPILRNHNWYFNYTAVEPLTDTYVIGTGHIDMVSSRTIRTYNYTMYFTDTIKCTNDETTDGWTGQMNSQNFTDKNSLGISTWVFTVDKGRMPIKEGVCFIKSDITKKVFGFLPATQTINTGPINVVYE